MWPHSQQKGMKVNSSKVSKDIRHNQSQRDYYQIEFKLKIQIEIQESKYFSENVYNTLRW